MRFIDIAVAGLIGMSAIAGLAAMSPATEDSRSRTLALRIQLKDALLLFLNGKGIAWFLQSDAMVICDGAAAASSRTLTISADVGGLNCGTPPSEYLVENLTLPLLHDEVVLIAWTPAPA